MRKRRHHYVWRHYLEGWATDGKIFCLQQGKIFNPGRSQVAVKRDFYSPQTLSRADLLFVRQIASHLASPEATERAEASVRFFALPALATDVLREQGSTDLDPLVVAFQEFEENYHSHLEGAAVAQLSGLRQRNADFLADDGNYADFLHFLFLQFFRTRKWQQTISTALKGVAGVDLERAWSVLRYLLADNCASSVYAERDSWRLTFLGCDSETTLLTADQPAFNIVPRGATPSWEPTELKLYYPVSPRTAILLSERKDRENGHVEPLGVAESQRYNRLVVETAYQQVYGAAHEDLRPFQL